MPEIKNNSSCVLYSTPSHAMVNPSHVSLKKKWKLFGGKKLWEALIITATLHVLNAGLEKNIELVLLWSWNVKPSEHNVQVLS